MALEIPGAVPRMSPESKKRLMLAIGVASLAIVLVMIGLVAGGAIIYALTRDRGPAKPAATVCLPDPKLAGNINALEDSAAEMKMQMTELGNQTAALSAQVEYMAGNSAQSPDLRASLPPPYVQKVDEFFLTAAPRALLSAKAGKDPTLAFGQPLFISHELISVPYTSARNEYYLIVKITIIDYYDLQFDVLWDSFEGQARP
jgi:hypothetical protein